MVVQAPSELQKTFVVFVQATYTDEDTLALEINVGNPKLV